MGNKKVTILRGISGSGKTTYTNTISDSDTRTCSADYYFYENGVYNFDRSKLKDAHRGCLKSFAEAVMDGDVDHIIVDNTNTSILEVSPYAQLALAFDYNVEVVTFLCNPELAHSRSLHGIDKESLGRQHERLMESVYKLPKWWNETVIDVR